MHYVSSADSRNYQPANITFDLLPKLENPPRDRKVARPKFAPGLEALDAHLSEILKRLEATTARKSQLALTPTNSSCGGTAAIRRATATAPEAGITDRHTESRPAELRAVPRAKLALWLKLAE